MKLLVRIAIWGALALVVLVGLTEAVLWLAAPVSPRAPLTYRFENQIPGLKEKVAFTVNGQGLRTWKSPQQEGLPLRLLCLGGAATSAFLQNDEDTWWGQLGSLAQKEFPDRAVSVSALFRDSTPLLHQAKWALEKLGEEKPDVVLVMGGLDDVLGQPADYTYAADKISRLPSVDGPRDGIKSFLLDLSQLARRYSQSRQKSLHLRRVGRLGELNGYAKMLAQARSDYARLPLQHETERTEGQDPALEFIDALNIIASSAKAAGSGLLIIGEPTLQRGVLGETEERMLRRWFPLDAQPPTPATVVRLDPGRVELEVDRYHASAEKLAQSLGVPFYHPGRKIPAHVGVFVEDTMLTDAGAAALAQQLLPLLKPLIEAPGR